MKRKRYFKNFRITRYCAYVAVLLLIVTVAAAATRPPASPEKEKQMGKEAAAEIAAEYEPVDDPKTAEKLQKMANTIAKNTPRPDVEYGIRYVQPKKKKRRPEVNAFSLPGGIIFVMKGLVEACQSDHELAGILAHEITHNTNYDGVKQAQRSKDIFKKEVAVILASVLLGGGDEEMLGPLIQAGMLYRQGVLGGYSIEMEKKADRGAVEYLIDTPWSPVGLLTFMERLAAKERREVPVEMGVFKTHPLSARRLKLLIAELQKHGIDINRRKTADWRKSKVQQKNINGRQAYVVTYWDQTVFPCIIDNGGDEKSAKKRAGRIRKALTDALAEGAQSFSFCIKNIDGQPAVVAYGKPILKVTDTDAKCAGSSASQLARNALDAIRGGIFKEGFQRLY